MVKNNSTAEAIIKTAKKKTESIKTSTEHSAKNMIETISDIQNKNMNIRRNIQASADAIKMEIDKLS